jgi:hypothetical protein
MQQDPRTDGIEQPAGDVLASEPPVLALAPEPPPGGPLRRHLHEWGVVWAVALASRVGVLVVGFLADYAARTRNVQHLSFARSGTFIHYQNVVEHGYTRSNATEYPMLPAMLAGLHSLGVPLAVAAMVLANLCFVAGLVAIAMIGARYVGAAAARMGALYLAVFPTSHYFSIASTESVMLVSMGAAVLLALRGGPRGWLAAAPFAAACALTRPPGALVGVVLLGIAVNQLRQKTLTRAGVAAAVTCGLAIPAAVAGFFVYLRSTTGDALAAVHAQSLYGRHMSLTGPWHAAVQAVHDVRAGSMGDVFEVGAALLVCASVVWFAMYARGDRREVAGWTAFSALGVLMPLSTGLVWQMERFALLIPPLFWMLGLLGVRRPRVHAALMVLLPMALAFKVVFEVVGVSQ